MDRNTAYVYLFFGCCAIAISVAVSEAIIDAEGAYGKGFKAGYERGTEHAIAVNKEMKGLGVCEWAAAVAENVKCAK